MTSINIIILVDNMRAFEAYDIPQDRGGCLYVPEGELVSEPAARFIHLQSGAIIILPQDFHPEHHVSFMENHPGVMASRKDSLRLMGCAEEDLDDRALDVLTMPFDNILLKEVSEGTFHAVAFKVGDDYHAVDTDENGRITNICSGLVAQKDIEGTVLQTLWRKHAVQGTESALFAAPIMAELPERLRNDVLRHAPDAVLCDTDDRRNAFYVIRKGTKPDLDSYGVATENDGISTTAAPAVFALIANDLQNAGVTEANVHIGGVATNFCVEFTHNDVYKYLVPELEVRGIGVKVYFLADISAGIAISVPDCSWPDLASASKRMSVFGTTETTTDDVIRSTLVSRSDLKPKPFNADA